MNIKDKINQDINSESNQLYLMYSKKDLLEKQVVELEAVNRQIAAHNTRLATLGKILGEINAIEAKEAEKLKQQKENGNDGDNKGTENPNDKKSDVTQFPEKSGNKPKTGTNKT